ncbi:MAG TPA: HEAT repeat domain-containing protein [Vicinamibacterales bacterium]|nr:HEAT repeat domain-containing protein [Vicinamibacterales bacterium]
MAELPELKDAPAPLDAVDTARLTDFARACKAAARAVVLYPAAHPAIAATLGRIAQITAPGTLSSPLRVTVLPDNLLLSERPPARHDAAISELATLLHSHLIGQLTVNPGGDVEAWRSFLLLLGRSPESVRGDGGIARVWTTMAGRHVELREIDYAEVLRERAGGESAVWDRVIANCLQGSAFDLDEEGIKELLGIAFDSDRLAALMTTLEDSPEGAGGVGAKTAAMMRMLRGIVDLVSKNDPERLEPVLRNMASAVGQVSPEMMLGLLHQPHEEDEGPRLMQAVVSRMTDQTIARFVSKHVIAESASTDRLALAFHSLVREPDQQQRLLALAREDVAASPLGSTEGFESVWNTVAEKLLTSYSDESFVSDEYGRELSGSRAKAIEVEQVNDDPPERISVWLGSIATTALRALDLTLVLDLLQIEEDPARWGELMKPVVGLLEDLLLVGDFDAAIEVIRVVVKEASPESTIPARRQHAITAIDLLIAGAMMRHITTHLATIDEAQFERVRAMCVSLGEVLVRPLAEALSTEERPRTRERLTSVLLAFGSVGRRTIERLKSSQNPAVRRTAIQLMRQFGGSESLPDLTELLDDSEPQVQREAVRAILNIGTDAAFRILEQALTSGTTRSRDAIMQSLGTARDERATPLFAYILGHVDHRGALAAVYLRAIESLGALRDPAGVAALRDVLYKGEWWAPRRTAALRTAAAAALARIGTPEALEVLEEAVDRGSRGIRSAARAQLSNARGRRPARSAADGGDA